MSSENKISLFTLLDMRYQWEELVRNYKIADDRKAGTLDNLEWYIKNGITNNRFREGFAESVSLAKVILKNA